MRRIWMVGLVMVAAALAGARVSAQLASRPAGDWVKVLEADERIAGLRTADVVARLGLRPGDVVADLGAGSGPFVVPFAKAVGGKGKVYAVEVDRGFFPFIEAKAKDAGVSNVQIVLGEFADPKLPAADVDVAFMHDVLHHIEDRSSYVKHLAKYLDRGARVAVIDYHPASSPHKDQASLQIGKDDAIRLFATAGLKPVQDVALFGDKWFLIFGR